MAESSTGVKAKLNRLSGCFDESRYFLSKQLGWYTQPSLLVTPGDARAAQVRCLVHERTGQIEILAGNHFSYEFSPTKFDLIEAAIQAILAGRLVEVTVSTLAKNWFLCQAVLTLADDRQLPAEVRQLEIPPHSVEPRVEYLAYPLACERPRYAPVTWIHGHQLKESLWELASYQFQSDYWTARVLDGTMATFVEARCGLMDDCGVGDYLMYVKQEGHQTPLIAKLLALVAALGRVDDDLEIEVMIESAEMAEVRLLAGEALEMVKSDPDPMWHWTPPGLNPDASNTLHLS